MTLIDGDRIVTAQLYDDEHEEFTKKKMSIIDYVNAYTDEGVSTADDVLNKIRVEIEHIETSRRIDEHTALIRTAEQAKKVALNIIDKYTVECGADIQEVMLATNPPICRKQCISCGWSYTDTDREDILRIPFEPPLEQEQKTGHWIEHKYNGVSYIECSKCSTWFLRMYLIRNSYCPNCGCWMVDPQESEEENG